MWSRNAHVAAIVLLHGRAVGTWKAAVDDGAGVAVEVATWSRGGVPPADAVAIRTEAATLAAGFFELPLTACVID